MSAIKPVPGHPGKFRDASGQVVELTEARETDRYDSEYLSSGLMTAGKTLKFFRDLTDKNELDANIPTPNKLVSGSERMILERIGVSIQAANSVHSASAADMKRIMCAGHLEIKLNRHVIEEGPLEKFPSGYGLAGSSTENNQAVVNVGVPSPAAIRPLREQQLITDKHTVNAEIKFASREWLGISTMPTLDDQNVLRLYCHGILEAAATNN